VTDAPPGKPQRVLIIKPSSLGDVITAVPVLHAMRRTFPDAHIAWLINPPLAGVLEGEGDLDEIIGFDRRHFGRIGRSLAVTRDFVRFCRELRRRRFDWAIDLQGLFRSGFVARVTGARVRAGFARAREMAWLFYTHRIQADQDHTIDRNIALAGALGVRPAPGDLTLTVTDEARASVDSILTARGVAGGRLIAVSPGTRWPNKLYPDRLWRKALSELARQAPVVLIGSPADRRLCDEIAPQAQANVINLAGQTSLPQLLAVIAAAGALLCCDSAASLIAPAVGTPFVTLTGPTRPERTGPYGPLGTALFADIPCIGCLRRSCPHATCMQLIDPSRVIAATREAFEPARGTTA